jgi:hypothetical protein
MTGEVPTELEPFVRQRTVLLETRRRNGEWVPTPVSIVVDGDHAYFRTYAKAGKVKRLNNFRDVRFAPSTFRGRPTGSVVQARATRADESESAAAAALLRRKYPVLHRVLVPLTHKVMRTQTLHYRLDDFSAE